MTVQVLHPARFSEPIVQRLHEVVDILSVHFERRPIRILDPMAGVGTVHRLRHPGLIETTGIEIEPEWAEQHPDTIEGDSTDMPFGAGAFEMVVFSPPYGNRMADQFVSKDGTKRITYYHFLGRRLHENSAAGKHFGPHYKRLMTDILVECKRVVVPNGFIVINVSDFIKAGDPVPVVAWYLETMIGLGYRVMMDEEIQTRRMRYGANHKLRVDSEHILVFALRRY